MEMCTAETKLVMSNITIKYSEATRHIIKHQSWVWNMDEGKTEEVKSVKRSFDALKWLVKKQAAPIQPAVVEIPLKEVHRKRWWPKANADKEAEIKKNKSELVSSLPHRVPRKIVSMSTYVLSSSRMNLNRGRITTLDQAKKEWTPRLKWWNRLMKHMGDCCMSLDNVKFPLIKKYQGLGC